MDGGSPFRVFTSNSKKNANEGRWNAPDFLILLNIQKRQCKSASLVV